MKFDLKEIFKEQAFQLTPKLNNLYFYNEIDIFPNKIYNSKLNSIQKSIYNLDKYELFLKQKGRRPNYDIYACFQPFNEATKALYPFLKKLKEQVKKGDTILNLWDRTGWLTSLLAGMFPEQHIITTWEGNKDVLGYNGFNFWMKNLNNVSVVFCDLNAPLPFKDFSITFSVGLDTLHRFNQYFLLQELERIIKPEGAILFPHVHLSNSEPTPFFERGGKQMHGLDYDVAFKNLFNSTNWKGYVFSEPNLFSENDISNNTYIPIVSNPNTSEYNALIALLPESWRNETLSAFSLNDVPNIENARVIVNLLLNINLNQQKISIDDNYLNGSVGQLLERHPIYLKRINNLKNYNLTELETKIIYLAKRGFTVQEISEYLNTALTKIIGELNKLEQLGLLQVLPISDEGIRLQYYIMSQEYLIPKYKQNLKSLWENAVRLFPENLALISLQDESEFTYNDCNEIIRSIIITLQQEGLKKGDKIIICNKQHPEAILLFWACMQLGIVVIPIGTHLPIETLSYIQKLTESKMCFTNLESFKEKGTAFENSSIILFDSEEEEEELDTLYFSDWLSQEDSEIINFETIEDTDKAVILFTSGSTGIPKGVQLSHGNLFRSGRLITENFHWTTNDRFFALGGLESMSGLRNSAIAALHIGASVVIPKESSSTNLFGITESVNLSKATIMGSNPALLRQLLKYKDKIRGQLDSIKTLICTGNKLSTILRTDIKKTYNLTVLNYYGLSETSGICTTQSPIDTDLNIDTIGKPIDCIAQIVDGNENLVALGEKGELRIYSENLMQGYFNDSKRTNESIRSGWFYTQDIARFTKNGNIELFGRKRNIVKTAKEELIYLDEIQQYLINIEFIEDVAVCSFEEEDTEKIAVFVTLNKSNTRSKNTESIKKALRILILKHLGENKIPNRIIILADLPYTESGKIIKNQLLNELH
jgi:acyl-coenzyme A synthetase/AMP-(fatty) acid ligase/SAM-dependent methyltransferase